MPYAVWVGVGVASVRLTLLTVKHLNSDDKLVSFVDTSVPRRVGRRPIDDHAYLLPLPTKIVNLVRSAGVKLPPDVTCRSGRK